MEVTAKFDHFNINVLDLKRSIEFYGKALGLKPCGEIEGPDGAFKIVYLKNELSDFKLELTWLRDAKNPMNWVTMNRIFVCVCLVIMMRCVLIIKKWGACASRTKRWDSISLTILMTIGLKCCL